jgi:cell division protein FtsN
LAQAGYEVNPTYKDVKVESSVPTANAIDKSLIKFKVQVGAYQNKIPTNVLDLYLSIGNVIPKKDPETGLTKYFVGTFNTYEEAVKFKQTLIDKGLVDAFVIGDFNGKIITATEALDLIK